MVALKYLLTILGIALFGSAGALVAYDVYVSSQLRRLLRRSNGEAARGPAVRPLRPVRWQRALLLAGLALEPLLLLQHIAIVTDGKVAVRLSQLPGVCLVTPFVDSVDGLPKRAFNRGSGKGPERERTVDHPGSPGWGVGIAMADRSLTTAFMVIEEGQKLIRT